MRLHLDLESLIECPKRRSRPKMRWADKISKKFGTSWKRKASDRQTWKGLVEVHVQKWAVEGAED